MFPAQCQAYELSLRAPRGQDQVSCTVYLSCLHLASPPAPSANMNEHLCVIGSTLGTRVAALNQTVPALMEFFFFEHTDSRKSIPEHVSEVAKTGSRVKEQRVTRDGWGLVLHLGGRGRPLRGGKSCRERLSAPLAPNS